MYVPFCKSADDVTIRLSLRHHFLPRLKKTLEHNHIRINRLYRKDRKSDMSWKPYIFRKFEVFLLI